MDNKWELRGTSDNPYHFSVGAVVRKGDTIAIIHTDGGHDTLLSETAYAHESVIDCLQRGAREELGVVVQPVCFLGSLITHFKRSDSDTDIEKSTLYFEAEVKSELEKRSPEAEEMEDAILWVSYVKALELLQKQHSPELEIVKRVKQ